MRRRIELSKWKWSLPVSEKRLFVLQLGLDSSFTFSGNPLRVVLSSFIPSGVASYYLKKILKGEKNGLKLKGGRGDLLDQTFHGLRRRKSITGDRVWEQQLSIFGFIFCFYSRQKSLWVPE
jgi:hypothetical protein